MSDQPLTPEQVRHVAKLARLALSDEELHRLGGQLQTILGYVAKLGELDVTNVEPMAHVLPLTNVLRDDDQVGPALSTEQVLQNAPETDGPFFKVPKILGGDDSE